MVFHSVDTVIVQEANAWSRYTQCHVFGFILIPCIPMHHFSLGHQTGYAHNVALLTETIVSQTDHFLC